MALAVFRTLSFGVFRNGFVPVKLFAVVSCSVAEIGFLSEALVIISHDLASMATRNGDCESVLQEPTTELSAPCYSQVSSVRLAALCEEFAVTHPQFGVAASRGAGTLFSVHGFFIFLLFILLGITSFRL